MEYKHKVKRAVHDNIARHTKCDSLRSTCRRCRAHNLECKRTASVRFRYGLDSEKQAEVTFPTAQEWVKTPKTLQYKDEMPILREQYEDTSLEYNAQPGTIISYRHPTRPQTHLEALLSPPNEGAQYRPATLESVSHTNRDQRDVTNHDFDLASTPHTFEWPLNSNSSQHSHHSSAPSPVFSVSSVDPFSEREAELMRNFTENMALWVDVTDVERHFEIEIPRRSLTNTILRYAIFAFSAKHLNRHRARYDPTESLHYHNRALQMLIPQLSGPEEGLTEEVFAAVVILRLDEEMDDIDNQFHLTGATRILNGISSFISSGGLGEAVAWTCLRQDIYISIVSKQPLRTKLEQFHSSGSVQRDSDMSWANKMILILAGILSQAFLTPSVSQQAEFQDLDEEMSRWQIEKPASFQPIRATPRSKEPGKRLPLIWMLSPLHVLGVQYYHIAKIVLLFAAPLTIGSVEDLQRSRRTEKIIREHLLTIIGLAVSNPKAENTLFTARHALVAWGQVLRNKLDQEAAISFLLFMEQKSGWRVTKTLDTLQKTWHENRDSD